MLFTFKKSSPDVGRGHNPVVTANNVWDLWWENIKSIPFLLFTHFDFFLDTKKSNKCFIHLLNLV